MLQGKGSEEVSTEAQHGSRWPPRLQPSGEETTNPPSACPLSFTHDSLTVRPAIPQLHLYARPLQPSDTDGRTHPQIKLIVHSPVRAAKRPTAMSHVTEPNQ